MAEIVREGRYFKIKYGDRCYSSTIFTELWQAEKYCRDYEIKKRNKLEKREQNRKTKTTQNKTTKEKASE